MKITKFVHSCVLVEDGDKVALFDPGIYSWDSGLVDVNKLPNLTEIICTHKHGDHMAEPFVKALVEKFPDVQWFAPSDAQEKLKEWGVKNVTDQSKDHVVLKEIDHEPVEPWGVQVRDLIVHWSGKVTHPGDTHEIPETMSLLLLPVDAPWGKTVRALQLPPELKAKYVFPIHDYMWNQDYRTGAYKKFTDGLAPQDIEFISPIDGQAQEVSIEV